MGFGSINVAVSALQAQREALDTIGHNIANANTAGYTRQRVEMGAVSGPVTPAMYSRWTGGGAGVEVSSISRMADQFLNQRSLQEHAANAGTQQTSSILNRAQLAFAEPSDNGLQEQLAGFWSSWDDVANNPDDIATRNQLLEKAKTVTAGFSQTSADLKSLSASAISQVGNDVADINSAAQTIAKLNAGIQAAVTGGLPANDLEDQRDQLVDKIGQLTGVTTRQNSNGMVDVFIGGNAIVRGNAAQTMHLDQSGATAVLRWDLDNSQIDVSGGKDGALLTAANTTLPGYIAQLDSVATSFITTVNTQQQAGVDLNSAPSSTPTGKPLLTGTGAGDIAVDPNITPADVAAASVNGGRVDGSNALVLAELGNSTTGPDAAYRSFIDTLGVDVQRAGAQASMQQTITQQTDQAQQSASGVNLDEEMTNMVAYQHAYEAAARFLTTVDQMMETLVNGTGTVGRK